MRDQFIIDSNHPVINNHRAFGRELLPGLAYVDIIYQLFRENGHEFSLWELKNLSIYKPLMVSGDKSILLTVEGAEIDEGQWKLCIDGQSQCNGDLASEKIRYVTAEMHRVGKPEFEETLQIDRLERSASKVHDLKDVYDRCERWELVHGEFMRAQGKVYETDGAVVVDASISEMALEGASDAIFHPVLVDGSAIGSSVGFPPPDKGDDPLYLPLFYESFRASRMLNGRCFTRIKKSSVRRVKELLYETLEFFDSTGKKIGELKNLTMKAVPENNNITGDTPLPVSGKQEGVPGVEVSSSSTETGIEKFLIELFSDKLNISPEKIDTNSGYYEMGLESPGLLEVVDSIQSKIKVTIPPTLLFEYTTIAELAAYFAQEHPARFGGPDAETRPEPSVPSDAAVAGMKDDIAIIGMAGRYPQAQNLREFWANLKEGRDSISEVPSSRWDWRRHETLESPSGKSISRWGGFIDGPEYFDSAFFRISPREAGLTDPQERLYLEVCWEAIEDAGYTPETLVPARGAGKRRPVGVFVGLMHKDYALVGHDAAVAGGRAFPIVLNNSSIPNRVSYFCNFHGPSMAIDTACSSSLSALHLALQSIRAGESEVALAGGVNLSLHQDKYISYCLMNMQSSDGRCNSFGEGGDGYVSGEGIGAVVLKPLGKAIRDRDHVYAVVKGSAVNHVGTVSGITVPSPTGQAEMIVDCLEKTGIDPRTISYVEGHGTGTTLGDPIEIQGLIKAYGQYTSDRQFCSIGSVKSNIGHTESAAGICGLTKVALQLHHKTLVRSLHSAKINKYIDFKASPFYVQQKTEEWKSPAGKGGLNTPRRAGLTSFGATGSNAHAILEEYVPAQSRDMGAEEGKGVIIPISAKNKERLKAYVSKMHKFLIDNEFSGNDNSSNPDFRLSDLAYTFQVGRQDMDERIAFVVKDVESLALTLEHYLKGRGDIENCFEGRVEKSTDGQDLIQKCIDGRRLEELARLWVRGLVVDWGLLYGKVKPFRMSLPTYPFAKVRHWVPESEGRLAVDKPSKPAETRKAVVTPASAEGKDEPRKLGGIVSRSLPEEQVPTRRAVEVRRPIKLRPTDSSLVHSERESGAMPSTDDRREAFGEPMGAAAFSSAGNSSVRPGTLRKSSPRSVAPAVNRCKTESLRDEVAAGSGRNEISMEEIQKELAESLAKALLMDIVDIGLDLKFVDMGLDSIVAVEWVGVVNGKYGTSISATEVYDYPTIYEFSNFLVSEPNKQGGRYRKPGIILFDKLTQPESTEIPRQVSCFDSQDSMTKVKDSRASVAATQSSGSLDTLREELIVSLAEVLFMDSNEVCIETDFVEMGLDSIVGVEWVRDLNTRYGISIGATKVYDYPNVRELAEYVLSELGDEAGRPPEGRGGRFSSSDPAEHRAPALNPMESQGSLNILQEELSGSLAEALLMDPNEVCAETEFVEMGLDSIVGVEWVGAINEKYGLSLAAIKVYDYPTIIELAAFIEKERRKNTEGIPSDGLSQIKLEFILKNVQDGNLDIQEAGRLLRHAKL